MNDLKKLARELSRCRAKGVTGGAGFPKSVRAKVCSAAHKHGITTVIKSVGISDSALRKWMALSDVNRPKKKTARPIALKELPMLASTTMPSLNNSCPIVKLTSQSGMVIEMTGMAAPEIAGMLRILMGEQ